MPDFDKTLLKSIKLIGFDVDGVLTGGEIVYSSTGTETKAFNVKDGLGIKLLQEKGIKTAIITGRTSTIVEHRAQELGIDKLFQGVANKANKLDELCQTYELKPEEIAYMGDDLPDLSILEKVGLAACPADAMQEVKAACTFVSQFPGGKGAARELCDLIRQAH